MVRMRAYRIECDECGDAIDSWCLKDAEEAARSCGWSLRSKRGDLCERCKTRSPGDKAKESAEGTSSGTDQESITLSAMPGGSKC